MQKENLPLKVDPFRFAENAFSLNGTISIKDMPRFSSSLPTPEGNVDVMLNFAVDEQGIRYVKGHYATTLTLQCQRCMEPYDYELAGDFQIGFAHDEKKAEQLPDRYDPWVVSDGELILGDMIEEELIISMPIVPMHTMQDCKVSLPFASSANQSADAEKENPFKVIEILRSKRKTQE